MSTGVLESGTPGAASQLTAASRTIPLVLILLVLIVVVLAGCSGPKEPPSELSSPPAQAVGGAAAWSDHVLSNDDPQALRHYLASVQEIRASRFEVRWNPATVAIDRAAAMRSLLRVSPDGTTFVFSASEPVVAKLHAGSILWIRNLALRKVVGVQTNGGVTTVRTDTVSLNEALPDADIEFETVVPAQNFVLSTADQAASSGQRTTSVRRPPPGFVPVRYGAEPPGGGEGAAPTPPAPGNVAQSPKGLTYSGSANGMEYSLSYTPSADGAVNLGLEARVSDGGGGGNALTKHLFEIVSDNVDIRFRAQAQVRGFTASALYKLKQGNLDAARVQFKDLKGHVTAEFVGRLGQAGNKGFKVPVMHIPASANIPIPVYGIPFVIQVGGDFLLTIDLAGKNATMSFSGTYDFDDQSGFNYSANNGLSDIGSIVGPLPNLTDHQGMSLGTSAVVLAIQLPRVGVGLDVIAASSIVYVDTVHVFTMTQAAAVGVGLLPPCKRITYNAVGHVGIETKVLLIPIPAVQKWVKNQLSGKKEIFNRTRELLDPPVKACQI